MLVRLLYVSRAVSPDSPETIESILADSRAHNLGQGITGILCYGGEEISERHFGGWTMGQVNLAKLNTSIVLKYSERPELDPYAVSGRVSLALLEELMATASIIGRA
jgi:hypothetical protein